MGRPRSGPAFCDACQRLKDGCRLFGTGDDRISVCAECAPSYRSRAELHFALIGLCHMMGVNTEVIPRYNPKTVSSLHDLPDPGSKCDPAEDPMDEEPAFWHFRRDFLDHLEAESEG